MIDPSSKKSPNWDQVAINGVLAEYQEVLTGKELLAEELVRLVKSEIEMNLRMELRNDVAVNEAEFIAIREFHRRLERGKIKFLSKFYIKKYICATAISFVRRKHARLVPLDDGNAVSKGELASREPHPAAVKMIKHADLYFCLQKLKPDEGRLVMLHHYKGMEFNEVAERMGITSTTARKRHSRVLSKLRLCLERFGKAGGVDA